MPIIIKGLFNENRLSAKKANKLGFTDSYENSLKKMIKQFDLKPVVSKLF
jgi:hypothetical protein